MENQEENKGAHPFVTIYCDIVEDTDASIDSDATINIVTPTPESPSITLTDHGADTIHHNNHLHHPKK
jgi:hypothetical protein